MNDLLTQVKLLKDYAKLSRDKASKDPRRLEVARNDLSKAIVLLSSAYENTEEGEYKTLLRRELADCYGMMGGIYRRQATYRESRANLERSLEMYEKGMLYETDDSYNLSNSVVISILIDPINLERELPKIQEGIMKIQDQVRGKRRDQWWAWADLGLLNLLMGNKRVALDAYEHFTQLGARTQDYESTISVLRQLRDVLLQGKVSTSEVIPQSLEDTIELLQKKSLTL